MAEILGLGLGPIPIGETFFPEESDQTCKKRVKIMVKIWRIHEIEIKKSTNFGGKKSAEHKKLARIR